MPKYAKVAGRKLEPLYDRLFVKRIDPITETEGGIVLVDQAQEKPAEGTILAVGPGRIDRETGKHVPMQLKVGDYVLFGKYGGMEVAFDDEKETNVLIIREDEILAREIGKANLGVRKLNVTRGRK
jgi:chaperonin GroES